mmetsp:Transcript_39509/g.73660  ORF Transcript_39509/g.73660 Transcript_39509/m.73660 type:complete len:86 (-) Transcript_39509:58-315(-)
MGLSGSAVLRFCASGTAGVPCEVAGRKSRRNVLATSLAVTFLEAAVGRLPQELVHGRHTPRRAPGARTPREALSARELEEDARPT